MTLQKKKKTAPQAENVLQNQSAKLKMAMLGAGYIRFSLYSLHTLSSQRSKNMWNLSLLTILVLSLFRIRLRQPQRLAIPSGENGWFSGVVVTPVPRHNHLLPLAAGPCEDTPMLSPQGIYTWHVAEETPSRNTESCPSLDQCSMPVVSYSRALC
jgi:hypothetical protein